MEVAEIWRYPVKSMAGEQLTFAELGPDGLPWDRGIAAFDRSSRRPDHPLSARQLPDLLRFGARVADGQVVVEAPQLPPTPWRDPAVQQCLSEVCGRRLELAEVEGGAFDDAPLHLVLLPSVAAVAAELGRTVDRRRFRANVFVTAPGLGLGAERGWVGSKLGIAAVVLRVMAECPRCAVTTRDPDSHESWPALLRHLTATRDAMMGVYATVSTPGLVGRGDKLTVLETRSLPAVRQPPIPYRGEQYKGNHGARSGRPGPTGGAVRRRTRGGRPDGQLTHPGDRPATWTPAPEDRRRRRAQ